MASFASWDAAGRPLTPAQPIEEFVAGLKAAFPSHANEFGWLSNDTHYEELPPQDHTPYSSDGWPLPDPEWVVFATDVMNTAVGGAEENQKLFAYWLGEAKGGRAPWIKYLIWRATIYDVRFRFEPQENSGHFDHIHVSARTDYEHHSLGDWPVVPGPTGPGEVEIMRFVFDRAVGGDGRHVYVTDGLRYRVQPLASDVDGWLSRAGAGPIVRVDRLPAPNWTFDLLVASVCGSPDPGEFAGGNADNSGLTRADLVARSTASTVTVPPVVS